MSRPFRLLFVTANRLGDAVLSTGVLGALLDAHPGARVSVAAGPVALPLFAAVPGVERLIPMAKQPRAGHWRALWRQTAFTAWDLVVDLRASAFAWLVPARHRLVFRPSHQPVHRVRQLGGLLEREDAPPPPRLWATDADRAAAAALVPAGGPVLAVGPTANWGGKQWPAEAFIAAVHRLTAPDGPWPGARVAVLAAPDERTAAQPLLDALPAARRLDLVGAAALPVLGACLARCAFYLGNDSGLMHMAAAAGIPTLGLFGPSREDLYGPWGAVCAAVRGPRGFGDIVSAPDYDYRSPATHMGDLTVETVCAAAAALWRRSQGAANVLEVAATASAGSVPAR